MGPERDRKEVMGLSVPRGVFFPMVQKCFITIILLPSIPPQFARQCQSWELASSAHVHLSLSHENPKIQERSYQPSRSYRRLFQPLAAPQPQPRGKLKAGPPFDASTFSTDSLSFRAFSFQLLTTSSTSLRYSRWLWHCSRNTLYFTASNSFS